MSKSSNASGTPTRPAMASRCSTAFVEPPIAPSATIALWNEPRDRIRLGVRDSSTIATIRLPARCASSSSRLSGAGRPALPGRVSPSASVTQATVDAVPIVLQCPRLRIIADSALWKSCAARVPARTSSESRHTSVPQPSAMPRQVPVSIGPPATTSAGRSTEQAAISNDGMVLSQPPSSTTPSIGLARSISSMAIAAMLRQSMAVGRTCVSPSDGTGISSGTPPASHTPRLTCSATSPR